MGTAHPQKRIASYAFNGELSQLEAAFHTECRPRRPLLLGESERNSTRELQPRVFSGSLCPSLSLPHRFQQLALGTGST